MPHICIAPYGVMVMCICTYGEHKIAIPPNLIHLGAKITGINFQKSRELIQLTRSGLPIATKVSLPSSFVML